MIYYTAPAPARITRTPYTVVGVLFCNKHRCQQQETEFVYMIAREAASPLSVVAALSPRPMTAVAAAAVYAGAVAAGAVDDADASSGTFRHGIVNTHM